MFPGEEDFASDPADIWPKITDEDANGKVIAASNWKTTLRM
jgi:hypothetical protein